MINRRWGWQSILCGIAGLHCAKGISTPATSQTKSALNVPLCAIVADPTQYDGKRVTVRGCITTDGREYAVLSYLQKPSSNGGIVPIDAPTLRTAQKFHAGPDKKICGTFTGTFRASTTLYDRVLEVEKTSNLQTS